MSGNIVRRALKLSRLLGTSTYRRGLAAGVGAAIEHEGALRSLELGCLIDVGANIGQFSLLARALHPDIAIHAVEPLPDMADRFERLFKADSAVRLHRIAAGEARGQAEIHVSARPDSSSLLPISARQSIIFPGTEEASTLVVRVERLDDVLADAELSGPILIKLDVQGFELAALKGMPRLLQCASYVYAELSFIELYQGQPLAHELIGWLSEHGFRISGVHNLTSGPDGETVQADVLFTNSDLVS